MERAEPRRQLGAAHVRMLQEPAWWSRPCRARYSGSTKPVALQENGVELVRRAARRAARHVHHRLRRPGSSARSTFDGHRTDIFVKEIAPARTFVLERDVEMLRARG